MTVFLRRAGACVVAVLVLVMTSARPARADYIRDQEWHLAALHIPEAHKISQGEGVIVGLPDTGVDAKHQDLTGAVLPGKGFGESNDTDGRLDFVGHGTAMAGLIAARGRPDGSGVLGIAPRATILPLQTLRSDEGYGVSALLAQGIDWALEHGARVICIAAGTSEGPQLRQSVERALRSDVVVVAAAGNAPRETEVAFPARLPGVLAVSGTDRDGNRAAVSVAGPEVSIAAPAIDVVSIAPGGKYETSRGTSDAAAIVAGVVALVRAKYPALSAAEVVRRITATATDKGKAGRDDEYGFGIVNPVAALTADVAEPSGSVSAAGALGAAGSGPGGGGVALGVVVALVVGGGLVVLLRRRVPRD